MEHVEFEKGSMPLSGTSGEWAWTLDLPTALNSTFDVLCLSFGVYILFTRSQAARAHAKQSNSNTPSVPASIPLATPSLWTRKRPSILLASTLTTSSIHLTRLFLILVLSLDARRIAQAQRAREAPGAMDDMGVPPTGDGINLGGNPLTRPPALYGVLLLPALMFLSRGLSVVLFAWPANRKSMGSINSSSGTASTPVVGTVPLPGSPGGPRLRKGSTAAKSTNPSSPTGTSFATNGHGPTSHGSSSQAYHMYPSPSPSPLWQFVSSLPTRARGPTQNLYLLAFYACVGLAAVFAPFSYHLVWYLDTLRIEFVLSLYLAAVLQDAKNVPGLSAKDKRARGIFTLERVVYARWAALALLLYGISLDAIWRVFLDGSLVFILWKVDV